MDKSPEAFRTISEVAEALDTPAHVLRFWESRFPQIRPVKRAGGRRYYRPTDVALLSGIRHLLHDQGMTIRGVQKVLREQGVRHVAALAPDIALPEEDDADFEAALSAARAQTVAEPESAEIVDLPTPAPGRKPLAPLPTGEAPAAVLHLHNPAAAPLQAVAARAGDTLPQAPQTPAQEDEVPEAGHVWVDDEPELDLSTPSGQSPQAPILLQRRVAPQPPHPKAPAPEPALASMFADIFADAAAVQAQTPKLSGLAARIRALPRPLSPEALLELTELHSRLGLLHAQIAEALNGRR